MRRHYRYRITHGAPYLAALLLAMLWLVLLPPLRADIVHLDNARSIEGVIEEETDRHIVIRVGGGRIRFERSRVVSIERGAPEHHEQKLRDWQEEHFLKPSFVPDELRPLAADFRRLLRERRNLRRATVERRRLEAREVRLLGEIDALHRETAEISNRLAAADPRRDPQTYNRHVAAANELNIRLRRQHRELEQTRNAMTAQQVDMDAYIRQFDGIQQRHHAARQAIDNHSADHRIFLEAMEQRLNALREDFQEYALETETRGSVSVVTARVNNLVDGRFIVDTGAGIVTISEAFAKRLNIASSSADTPTTQVVTADGRRVEAVPIVIESLNVDGLNEKNVSAVILKDPPGNNIDGLLGMSFLRRFNVSLEGSGRLILRRLDPH